MFTGMRGTELLIILAVVLLLFGARKLPELARSLGASAKEFRRGISDASEENGQETGDGPKEESEVRTD